MQREFCRRLDDDVVVVVVVVVVDDVVVVIVWKGTGNINFVVDMKQIGCTHDTRTATAATGSAGTHHR